MRHEDGNAAIATVRAWFGGLSTGQHIRCEVSHLIAAMLEAQQLADWLDDNGNWHGGDSQQESVALLWAIARACDVDGIRQAISTAEEYADDIRAGRERGRRSPY